MSTLFTHQEPVARIMSSLMASRFCYQNARLVKRTLPKDVNLKDLGEHCLKASTEHLYQITASGLRIVFHSAGFEARPSHNAVELLFIDLCEYSGVIYCENIAW
jgi:hypothetical protein